MFYVHRQSSAVAGSASAAVFFRPGPSRRWKTVKRLVVLLRSTLMTRLGRWVYQYPPTGGFWKLLNTQKPPETTCWGVQVGVFSSQFCWPMCFAVLNHIGKEGPQDLASTGLAGSHWQMNRPLNFRARGRFMKSLRNEAPGGNIHVTRFCNSATIAVSKFQSAFESFLIVLLFVFGRFIMLWGCSNFCSCAQLKPS